MLLRFQKPAVPGKLRARKPSLFNAFETFDHTGFSVARFGVRTRILWLPCARSATLLKGASGFRTPNSTSGSGYVCTGLHFLAKKKLIAHLARHENRLRPTDPCWETSSIVCRAR